MPEQSMEALSDEALVTRIAVAETEALGVLISRYRKRVYGMLFRVVGRSEETDDLFQETWIRVARGASGFDPSRKFAPWLARIATNLAIDWVRQRPRESFQDASAVLENTSSTTPSPEQELVGTQRSEEVARALHALPEAMRQTVLLRYFHELSEAETAASLGIPKGTVKSRLHKALRALREHLGEESDVI